MTTSTPLEFKTFIENYNYTSESLKKHQELVVNLFFSEQFKKLNSRGLLLNHSMGSGKTILATSLAEKYKEEYPNGKVIILTNKSLESNFRETIEKIGDLDRYHFVTLNAGNVIKKLIDTSKSKEELIAEKNINEKIYKASALENTMLIVDEAHNLFNSITNGSKNAVEIYDMIMESKTIKLVFMSGTVIVNDPFELVPCFNMLKGRVNYFESGIVKYDSLFPEDRDLFEKFFIDVVENEVINKEKFKNRIYGLSSYYNDLYFEKKREGFPDKKETKVIYCPMSSQQFSNYVTARLSEISESTFKAKDKGRFSSSKSSSSYRIRSRQISNIDITKGEITEFDIPNIKNLSTKFSKLIENIKEQEGHKSIIFSQFVNFSGLASIEIILKSMGYVNFVDNQDNIKTKTFAIISGDVDPNIRDDIRNSFNDKNGGINILLLSGAMAEGLDLKRINYVHIIEPFFNYARIRQAETRANRYLSHIDMPKELQFTQTFIYLSTYPEMKKEEKKMSEEQKKDLLTISAELSTDEYLYTKSIKNMTLNNKFMLLLAESSIDCFSYGKVGCKLCNPTNTQLSNPDISKDIIMSNPCTEYKSKNIKAKTIKYNGETYYVDISNENVYKFNKNINAMEKINHTNPIYYKIMEELQ